MFYDARMARRSTFFFSLSWLITTYAFGMSACVDDSSNAPPLSGTDAGLSDAPGSTNDGASLNDAGASPDSPSNQEGGATLAWPLAGKSLALANLWSTPLDLCVRKPGDPWTGPLFAAESGIPVGSVSAKRSVQTDRYLEVSLIPAGQTCAATPVITGGTFDMEASPRIVLVIRESIGDVRQIQQKETPVAGKDNVFYGRLGHDVELQPSGGGAAIAIADDKMTSLDANVTGTLSLTQPNHTATRQMKTAVGIFTIIDTGPSDPILCDELAPPAGHLMSCGPAVRSP